MSDRDRTIQQLKEETGILTENDLLIFFDHETGVTKNIKASKVAEFYVPTLREAYSVPNVYLRNDDGHGRLTTNHAIIEWEDLRNKPENEFPINVVNGFNGRIATLTQEDAQRINNYVVYMYVNDYDYPPISRYPGPFPSGNEFWYYCGETSGTYVQILVPKNKYVSFWVGFKIVPNTAIPKRIYQL